MKYFIRIIFMLNCLIYIESFSSLTLTGLLDKNNSNKENCKLHII